MCKSQKGFSVIEVLVILVVIGALGAAGWYTFQRIHGKASVAQKQ
jgi:type II secretory pathway pseudopilin PulG